MIKGLVFDFDGLILDTETLMYEATNALYEEYGASLPIQIWGELAGTHDDEFNLYEDYKEKTGSPLAEQEFYKERDGRFNEIIKEAKILPGVKDLLKAGRAGGLKIALATSSGDQWAKTHLDRLELLPYFDFIVEANDVAEVKPHPELFLKACEGIGVKPEEAIAFEDSYHGAVSAKRAGLYCVVIPNTVTKGLSFESDIDLKLASLGETSLEDLLARFSSNL